MVKVFNQQVKQVIKYAHPALGDYRIIKVIPYADPFLDQLFEIYRVQIVLNDKTHYLDIITNAQQHFLSLGGNHSQIDFPFYTSKQICDSLAIQKYLENAN